MDGAFPINQSLQILGTANRARIVPITPAEAAAAEAAASPFSTPPGSPTPLDQGAENDEPLPALLVPKDSDNRHDKTPDFRQIFLFWILDPRSQTQRPDASSC
jgi:hypothetical protein